MLNLTKLVHASAGLGLGALLLGGCAHVPPAPVSGEATSIPAKSHASEDSHSSEEFYEAIPEVTWTPETDREVKAVATKVIELFARPDVPERRWFTDLLPYLSDQYAEHAQYIDPANVRVTEVLSDPALIREKDNPLTVTADFSTDAGPWSVLLHRVGQSDPWLVEAIQPSDPTNP